MDKRTVKYSYNGILHSSEKMRHISTWINLKNINQKKEKQVIKVYEVKHLVECNSYKDKTHKRIH